VELKERAGLASREGSNGKTNASQNDSPGIHPFAFVRRRGPSILRIVRSGKSRMLEPKSTCTSSSHQPASKTKVDSGMGDISAFELRKRPTPLLQLILSLMETRAGGRSCVWREGSIRTDIGRKGCKWRLEVGGAGGRDRGIEESQAQGKEERKKADSRIQYTIATDADINMQKQRDLEHDQLNQ